MLELAHLHKTFLPGTPQERAVLRDLCLSVKEGDFITLLGSNGSGKSTLFDAISGSFLLDSGSILLGGQDITFLPEHKRAKLIGRLFQDPLKGTAPDMTIEENLSLACNRTKRFPLAKGVTKKDLSYFKEVLSSLELGLEDRMKTKVGLLSGGQRQALTLMMATLVPPKLLLLDEHTAALDPSAAEKVLKLTKEIVAAHHITTLMITHDLSSALEIGNRTIMLNEGKVVLDVEGAKRESFSSVDLLSRYSSAN